jgi:hypothetical protein
MDPLTEKYLEVLNEGNDTGVVKTTLKTGNSFEGTEKLNKADEADVNVDLDKPVEDKRNSSDEKGEKDGALEKAPTYKEAANPFEDLYNKILQEDAFGWEIENGSDNGMGEIDNEVPSLENSDESEEESEEEEEESEEVTLTLDKETAQKLIDVLQTAIGGESEDEESENEESEDEEFDFGASDEENEESEDEEETVKEEVDAEVVGHALVDQEKLLKGMNKPSNNVVKSTIKAHKKKAQVPSTGKGFKGELTKQSDSAGKSLQNKNNKVAAVNVGKGIIDNK